MTLKDFNENHLNPLMEKLTDKKHTFLLGDFNIDLMKTEEDENSSVYLDTMTANLFVPHITQLESRLIRKHVLIIFSPIFKISHKEIQEISLSLSLTTWPNF